VTSVVTAAYADAADDDVVQKGIQQFSTNTWRFCAARGFTSLSSISTTQTSLKTRLVATVRISRRVYRLSANSTTPMVYFRQVFPAASNYLSRRF
jgi:hypothetical protein